MTAVGGIHHVTAIAGDAQANLDFYTGVLGLRLVKRTVNFDDPGTYHFYYGDENGAPGSILTFFPWGRRSFHGRIGTGQVSVTSFSAPAASLEFWTQRLTRAGIAFQGPIDRFDETALAFHDPDGLGLEIVAVDGDSRPGWARGDIPAPHALRGFHAATLLLDRHEKTAGLLTGPMGMRAAGEAGQRFRFAAGDGAPGRIVDLVVDANTLRGNMGTGVVHHIAWRADDDAAQSKLRDTLTGAGREVTPVLDRNYFRSVYFREPGGVLFEIATDPPGFSIDEPAAELGMHLKLPAWLEDHRGDIEARLSPISLPRSNNPAAS
jgi:glyoxalase family protein